MDEQERLIARAALCDAETASAAWDEFCSSIDLKQASPVLSWAAGYIHRNLESLGRSEPYLAGIARHNWLRNNLILADAQVILSELTSQWTITPLKSFGLGAELTDRRLRPLADIDIYVEPKNVLGVVATLRSRGFTPLLDVSDREFRSRILPQRGSWNFHNSAGLDIDVHWKLFDHLDESLNSRLAQEHSAKCAASFGPIRQLSPELMVAMMCVQQQVQHVDSNAGLFDINGLLKHTDPHVLVSIAQETGSEHALTQSAVAIARILGATPEYLQAILDQLPATNADVQPMVPVRRFWSKTPRDTWNHDLVKNRFLYWAWWKLGHFARVERTLVALFGPFSQGAISLLGETGEEVRMREVEQLGPGWHHCYPADGFRWANRPDARCVLAINQGSALRMTLDLDETMWRKTPVESIDVFLDGVLVSRIQRTHAECHFTVPARSKTTRLELSFREAHHTVYSGADIHTNWYGLALPVERITIERAWPSSRS